jgi:hypothetical protein
MTSEPVWRPTRQWRRHVYYKVQVRDPVSMVWRDEKPAFDALEEAREHSASRVEPGAVTRIMAVDGRQRTPVEE